VEENFQVMEVKDGVG